MDQVCRLCENAFPRRKKCRGFEKTRIDSPLRRFPISVHAAMLTLYSYEGPCEGHICWACYAKLNKHYQTYTTMLSPIYKGPSPKKRTTPVQTAHIDKKQKTGEKDDAWLPVFCSSPRKKLNFTASKKHPRRIVTARLVTKAVKNSNYYSAFRHLLSRGQAAEKAFFKLISKKVKREVKQYVKDNSYPQINDTSSVEKFSWSSLLGDMKGQMTTLVTAIEAAMPCVQEEKYRSLILPRRGFMLSILLYTINPKKFSFLQAVHGVQMWRCGSSNKLVRCFNHLGICQSASVIRRHVDKFCEEPDINMKQWKEALEQHGNETVVGLDVLPTQEITEVDIATNNSSIILAVNEPIFDDSDDKDSQWEDLSDESDEDYLPFLEETQSSQSTSKLEQSTFLYGEEEEEEMSCEPGCGYALVWDNTQIHVQKRDQSRDKGNSMQLWANCYAVKNRVDPKGMNDNDVCLKACDIPYNTYFHSTDDEDMLRVRMETIVSRILVQNVPHFEKFYQDVVECHIPHRYEEEAAKKSELINIGIIHANPSSTEGVISIMETLQQYSPRRKDGSFRVVPTHGDALSVERMNDAKKARTADITDTDRLEGLEATPQEFHHRGLMMQETMNVLFSGKSIAERGTLSQLKNAFQHRNVSKDVMNSFNYVDNFLRFTTEAHIVYLALKICAMDSINDIPSGSVKDATTEERREYLMRVSRRLVRETWLLTPDFYIQSVLEADEEDHKLDWCFCCEDKEESMVKCSNRDCPHGAWFHTSCVNMEEIDIPGPERDWWCSIDCKNTGSSCQCVCKTIKNGPVIHCSRGNECSQGMVFHLDCVKGIKEAGEKWYCSRSCSDNVGEPQDHVRNYALAVVWYGLLDLSHRDMIREGDGLAMVSMWRINVPRFWSGNHYKYLIIAHRLLAGVSGWLKPRLIEEIVNNRTASLKGGKGNNIALDRVCEFLNAEFKETLKHAHGNYSHDTINRAGRIVGALGKALDRVFEENVAHVTSRKSYRRRASYQNDIHAFVEEYKCDRLFNIIPGRQHQSFQGFNVDMKISNPDKLRSRLVKYTRKLDRTRLVVL